MKVNSGFLPAMQIPILLGRGFEDRNLGAPRVAVVIGLGKEDSTPADIEIIGVAQLRAEGRSAIAGSGGAQDRA